MGCNLCPFVLRSLSGGKYTKEIHQKLIQEEDAVICIFCSKPIQDPGRPKRYFCCDSVRLIKDGYLVRTVAKYMINSLLANTLTFMKIDIG